MTERNELRFLERARAEVIKFLQDEPELGLYNLSLSDLGLNPAINIIAETIEKRVDLGDFEATAIEIALDAFQSFLEVGEDREAVFDFAQYMANFCLPLIERPDGKFTYNATACTAWRDSFLEPLK